MMVVCTFMFIVLFVSLIGFLISCKLKGGKKSKKDTIDEPEDASSSTTIHVTIEDPNSEKSTKIDGFKKKGLGKND